MVLRAEKASICSKGHFEVYIDYKLCYGIYVGVI